MLVASGLVAGEALLGILLAGVVAMSVKFFCPQDFQDKVAEANTFMEKLAPVGEDLTPPEIAASIVKDPSTIDELPVLQGMDEAQLTSHIAVQKSLAATTCLGTTPKWFGNMWLGFLVIVGLGFYMVITSLRALKKRAPTPPGSGGPAPPAEGSATPVAPDDAQKAGESSSAEAGQGGGEDGETEKPS